MAGPIGASLDRVFVIMVDPDTGQPVAVSAGGAITVTGTLTAAATAITENTNTTVAIAGSTSILAANPARRRFMLFNLDTANRVHLRFAAAAAVTTNIPLQPLSYYDSEADFIIYQGEIRGIESAGAPSVAVVEFV